MLFTDYKPIYLQIVDLLSERLLTHFYHEHEKLPSVRALATSLEVNANTVLRAYAILQEQRILVNKRGKGVFVATDGLKRNKQIRKKAFLELELPQVYRTAKILGVRQEEMQTVLTLVNQNSHMPKRIETKKSDT